MKLNPYKQTLPKSSNERKNNYLYNPNKRINSVVPITKPKVLSQERNLREPKYFKDIFNLIDIDKWLDDVNIELQNMKNLKRFLRLQNGFPKELISSQVNWVFKYKKDPKGNIIKRKPRLVPRGFTQR